jgi:peptide deformylase
MTSRILQHEIDHLNGITFLKRADRYHLEQAKKELKKLKRARKRNETTSN